MDDGKSQALKDCMEAKIIRNYIGSPFRIGDVIKLSSWEELGQTQRGGPRLQFFVEGRESHVYYYDHELEPIIAHHDWSDYLELQ